MDKVAIVGAGSWGTALAVLLAGKGTQVRLYARNTTKASYMREFRENITYLPGVRLPEEVKLTAEWVDIADADIYVVAVPSHVVLETIREIKKKTINNKGLLIVNVAKGFDEITGNRLSVEAALILGEKDSFCTLSGPTHAEEVGRQMPAAIVAASENENAAKRVQELFMTDRFRVYTNHDLAGVEIAGATKNVIALAAGITAGLGFGDNSSAALVTRGLHEITRLGVAMGSRQETFSGLAGIGDLMVTCNSRHSRNRKCGVALGQRKKLKEILNESSMVVEGVKAAKITKQLSERYDVEMPIVDEVYQILFEDKDPRESVLDLMLRRKKNESHLGIEEE
jgi:glycerol-3-phosphate dehydrogenase (NAD(P)+)